MARKGAYSHNPHAREHEHEQFLRDVEALRRDGPLGGGERLHGSLFIAPPSMRRRALAEKLLLAVRRDLPI
jgi:hypothetical protein